MIPHEPLASAGIQHDDHHYLIVLEQFVRIDQLLKQRILHLQQETQALNTDAPDTQWGDNAPDWLCARQHWQAPEPLDEDSAASHLGQLVQRFALSPLARDILLLASLPQLDGRYHSLFAQAQGQNRLQYPTVQFALDILCPEPRMQAAQMACLLPGAPLLRTGLLKLDSTVDGYHRSMLKPEPSIYHFLIGHAYLPTLLSGYSHWQTPPLHIAASLNDFAHDLSCALDSPAITRIVLKGVPDSGRTLIIAHAAQRMERKTLVLDLSNLPEESGEALSVLQAATREVQLHNACLTIRNLAPWQQRNPRLAARWKNELQHCQQPLVSVQDEDTTVCWLDEQPHLVFTMPPRSLNQDRLLLEQHLQDSSTPLADDIDLDLLTQRFPVVASRLPSILQEAELYRLQRDPKGPLQHADLHRAFRWRSQQNFGTLAQRIEPRRSIEDWIVADDLQQHMQELLGAIRLREHAISRGFTDRNNGISALFHGSSGAGKSMAAEVLAHALGVDLIKVDLSTVINKYIGETEKNLSTIFNLAALDSGVLFFDEADALFGKRGESKDAKDRHANIEVAYLLQRMETHAGLVILSTNNRSHLDNAFSRRFTFAIKFGYPDRDTRRRLWRHIWPQQVRLAHNVDLDRLAVQAEITGANIRNIALAACWLAASDGAEAIGMEHIQQALKRELAKTGQVAFT